MIRNSEWVFSPFLNYIDIYYLKKLGAVLPNLECSFQTLFQIEIE